MVELHFAPPRGWRPTPFLLASAGLHAGGLLALALAPQRWPMVAGALVADHLLLAGSGMAPGSRLLGPNLSRLSAAAASRGEVALTFDDGPDREVTPRVLDCLERGGVRATFFCIGRRAAAAPELAAEIASRGHRVENHSYDHSPAFACYPPAALHRDIARAQEILERTAGRRPRLFRAPAGIRSLLLERELVAAGLALASWSRRGFDTVSRRPERVVRRLLHRLAAGDVLLLHDGSAACDEHGIPVVLEVLPRLLDELAKRGLRPVPMTAPEDGG